MATIGKSVMRSFELLGPPLLAIFFAIGFAFDVNTGLKPNALEWMQRAGLTWLFRVASAPGRLLMRSFHYHTLFLYYLLHDAIVAPRA